MPKCLQFKADNIVFFQIKREKQRRIHKNERILVQTNKQ
jgi:hypothetical protein